MTKDVLIKIKGLHSLDMGGDTNPIELITSGQYYNKNGKHYILYEEVVEGFDSVIQNRIKLEPDRLVIRKQGAYNTEMIFERHKKNLKYYENPFVNILLGIDANEILLEEEESSIRVKVNYELEVNARHLADCNIAMDIQSKEYGQFTI